MLHPLTGQNIDPNADPNDDPNDEHRDEQTAARMAVGQLLMAIGNGLFLVFLAYAVVDSLPFQLLNPRWQLALVARLLSTGLVPLVGFACVHLAAILNPANSPYRRRLETVRRWAMVAAIGFLLLIALQGFATWRSYTGAKTAQQTLMQTYKRRIAPLKQAINSATSTADLQQKLVRLQEFRIRLAPEDLSQPLDLVKKAVDDSITREENLYADRISGPKPNQIWAAIQAGARTFLASLGYFLAFAAGAQPGRSSPTLLDMLSRRFQSLFGLRRRRSRHPQ